MGGLPPRLLSRSSRWSSPRPSRSRRSLSCESLSREVLSSVRDSLRRVFSRRSKRSAERRFDLREGFDSLRDPDGESPERERVVSSEFGVRFAAVRLLVREFDSANAELSFLLPPPMRLFSRPRVPSVLVPF